MKFLTVSELAKSSGVTVRTLHHYHEIGLLKPALTGENGYRYYGRDEVFRLQQIMFWRELGMPLAEISSMLDGAASDPVAALIGHRGRLKARGSRIRQLVRTIDRTIAVLKGERQMNIDELYQGFTPENQTEYEAWLKERFGDDPARGNSRARWLEKGPALMDRLRPIEADLSKLFVEGVASDDPVVAPALERHRKWVSESWGRDCSLQAYAGLAGVYEHADFRDRFETLAPGFAVWLVAAMRAHAAR